MLLQLPYCDANFEQATVLGAQHLFHASLFIYRIIMLGHLFKKEKEMRVLPPTYDQEDFHLPVNLARGWPSPEFHPTKELLAAAQNCLTNPSVSVPGLQYGPDPGYEPLRRSISKWLAQFYSTEDDFERICISGGASQNLACALQVFTDPNVTKRVWMVAPCYYLASSIFEDAGFAGRLRAVPEDDGGMDVNFMEAEMEKLKDEKPRGPVSLDFSLYCELVRHIHDIKYAVPSPTLLMLCSCQYCLPNARVCR